MWKTSVRFSRTSKVTVREALAEGERGNLKTTLNINWSDGMETFNIAPELPDQISVKYQRKSSAILLI